MPALARRRAGFSLIELLIVIVIIGIMAAVIVPRFRVSPSQRAYYAARQLAADLESVRSRAAAMATNTRMRFDAGTSSYEGFLDTGRDGVFAYSATEVDSLGTFRGRTVEAPASFGRDGRAAVPGFPEADAVTFAGSIVTFDPRGLLRPIGERGAIYIRADGAAGALAAVTITGSGNVRIWRWKGNAWE